MIDSYKLYHHAWIYCGPLDEERKLSRSEVNALLSKGGLMVRNVYDFDKGEDTSFWYVIKDSMSVDCQGHSTLKRVKKSLDILDINRVSAEVVSIDEWYTVQLANFRFYKTKTECPSKKMLKDRIEGLDECFDLWEARTKDNGQLVAWAIRKRVGYMCEYQTIKADPAFFSTAFPFYAMYYVCNDYYLREQSLAYVSDGARSATQHSHVQEFLIKKFGFRKAYCRVEVTYIWWLSLLVKIIYPLRHYIPDGSLKALLNIEAMSRGEL